jgi:hypothetical protein
VILLGALLYATGPVTIGLVPTRAGSALARAWASAAVALLLLGVAWATLFAVGALLIGDSGTAGPLIAGNSALGSLAGGLLLAVAGLASLWLCLKAAREVSSLLRLQLSGLLVLGGQRAPSAATPAASARRTTGQSLREYGSRLGRAAGAAGGELALVGAGGGAVARAGRAAGYVGRRGLIGTAAGAAGRTAAASPAAAVFARSRPGAVAVRMARAGTASWQTKPNPGTNRPEARTAAAAAQVANATRQNPSRGRPGRRAATTGGRSDAAPTSSAHTRSSSGARTAPPNGNGSPGGAPTASADRSARSTGRSPSSSARPASPRPAEQHGSPPASPPGPKPARKPFAARRARPFRTRKPPKGEGR